MPLVGCNSTRKRSGAAAATSHIDSEARKAFCELSAVDSQPSPSELPLAHPPSASASPAPAGVNLGWRFSAPSSAVPLKSLPSPCRFTRDESELPLTLQNHIAESIDSGRISLISTTSSSLSSTPSSRAHSRSHSRLSLMSDLSTESAGSDFDSPPSMSLSATPASSESPPTQIRVCPLGTPPLLPLDGQLSDPASQSLDPLGADPLHSLSSPRDTNCVGWFHAFTPAVGTVVRQLDYSFVWTAQHPRISALMEMRQRADPDADELLAKLQIGFNEDALAIIAQRAQRHTATMKQQQEQQDQQQPTVPPASSGSSSVDADCFQFMLKYSSVPSWVDWTQVARGQRVFQRYGPIGLLILLYSSLIGGFGAPLVVKVLNSSNNLSRSCPAAYARLVQTSLAILACMGPTAQSLFPVWSDPSIPDVARAPPVGSELPHRGDGWMASLRTRFLHAQVRKMLLHRPGGWDTETYGVPINQEDQSLTLLSFSFNLIDTLKRMGITLTLQETDDFMQLWKYIGFLSGVDPVFLETSMTSYAMALPFSEAAWFHLVHPDRSSQELVRFVLSSVEHCFPFAWTPEFHAAVARTMLTPAWSAAIGLPAVGRLSELKVKMLFGWLWCTAKLSYVNRWIGKAICYINFAAPCALSTYRFGSYIAKRDASKRAVIAAMDPLDAAAASSHSPLPSFHPHPSVSASDTAAACPFLANKSAQPAPAPPSSLLRRDTQLDLLKRLCHHAGCTDGGCQQPAHTKSAGALTLQLLMLAVAMMLLCGLYMWLRSTGAQTSVVEAHSAAQLS